MEGLCLMGNDSPVLNTCQQHCWSFHIKTTKNIFCCPPSLPLFFLFFFPSQRELYPFKAAEITFSEKPSWHLQHCNSQIVLENKLSTQHLN